jgi:ferredoxin-type protein NapH
MNKYKFVLIPAVIIPLLLLAVSANLKISQQANGLTIHENVQIGGSEKNGKLPFPLVLNSEILISLPPFPCYGPHMTANISQTQLEINESVIVAGKICPPKSNATVLITFIKPDYSFINVNTPADNQTGDFSVTQKLDMIGLWNIFTVENHITDRVWVNVTDPSGLASVPVAKQYPLPPDTPYVVPIAVFSVGAGVAVVAVAFFKKDRTRKISSIRLLVQIVFVFLLFVGIFPNLIRLPEVPSAEIAQHEYLLGTNIFNGALPDGLPVPTFGCYYPCGRTVTCVLWQIQTYIYPFWDSGHGWAVNYNLSGIERLGIVFGVVILVSILLGRFWCGWVCPFGLYLDLTTRLRKALRVRHRNFSPSFNEKFHQLSYVILALIIIVSVIFASQAIVGAQLVPGTQQGGFIYTYFSAPFCQVCPMKPLCLLAQTAIGILKPGWTFGTTTGQFYQLGYYVTSLNVAILAIVTLAAFFIRRSWCRICPLGGLIALFNRFQPFKWISGVRLEKAEEKCTKCGVCKRVCPTQVTKVYEGKSGDVANSQCILCLRCIEMCPEKDCLKFKFAGKTVCGSQPA